MRVKKVIPVSLPEGTFKDGISMVHPESGDEMKVFPLDNEKYPNTLDQLLDFVAVAASEDDMKDTDVYVYLVDFGSTHYGQLIWDKEAEPKI